jgi:DNA-binding transcriptional MerR regulator
MTLRNSQDLISAGELATLANTTKRTIHFYDKKGVLKPTLINQEKYRFYKKEQVLDYQKILLLTTLRVSLGDIKKYLEKRGDLNQLFNSKKKLIEKEIKQLQFNLNNLNKFQKNLSKNKTMVNPKTKTVKNLEIFYIEKIGSYAKIGRYCQELISMLHDEDDLTTLAIFDEQGYRPKKSKIKIGVIKKRGIKIKKEYQNQVKSLKFEPGRCLTYTHNGSGSLLSLFWKELEKYAKINKIKVRQATPDFEIYHQVNQDHTKQFFEICLPIK